MPSFTCFLFYLFYLFYLNSLLELFAFDDTMHVYTREMDIIRGQYASVHNLFYFGDGDLRGGSHAWIEITSCVSVCGCEKRKRGEGGVWREV